MKGDADSIVLRGQVYGVQKWMDVTMLFQELRGQERSFALCKEMAACISAGISEIAKKKKLTRAELQLSDAYKHPAAVSARDWSVLLPWCYRGVEGDGSRALQLLERGALLAEMGRPTKIVKFDRQIKECETSRGDKENALKIVGGI